MKDMQRRTNHRRNINDPPNGLTLHNGWSALWVPFGFRPPAGQIPGDEVTDDIPVFGMNDRQAFHGRNSFERP